MNQQAPQPGKIMLVGLGPGAAEHMTGRARSAIAEAEVVIGYSTYIRLAADLLAGKEVVRKGMTEELDRAMEALERARRGQAVALVSSGDAGVYGMAGPTFEVLFEAGWEPGSGIEVEVVPGASALNSCAALVGAPLTHDFCAISLSDLLTPWPVIARRLDAAAAADFVVALYNPKSGRRTAQIVEAQRLLLAHRPPETPVAIVKSAYRARQRIELTTLERLAECDIGMLSTVLVGSSSTFVRDGLMVTPRGYAHKYAVGSGTLQAGEQAGRSLAAGLEGWRAEVRASGEPAEELARRHRLPVGYLREVIGEAVPARRYSEAEREAIYRAIRERRDMRHFRPEPVDPAVLRRLLEAAHQAPSVGYMQPWRFIRITDPALREAIHALAAAEQEATAAALGERGERVRRLKLEGIRECGELLVVSLADGRERHLLGRRTLPEMDLCSAACAIQNLWLAARAEGLGLGWVSLFDPEALARLLELPDGARPLAVLCLGHVEAFYPEPMLETVGWDRRRPFPEILFENRWGEHPTEVRVK